MARSTRIRRILAHLAPTPPIGHWEPALVHAVLSCRSPNGSDYDGDARLREVNRSEQPTFDARRLWDASAS